MGGMDGMDGTGEGGHRVPGIIAWPAVVGNVARESWNTVITSDFLPTVRHYIEMFSVAFAGLKLKLSFPYCLISGSFLAHFWRTLRSSWDRIWRAVLYTDHGCTWCSASTLSDPLGFGRRFDYANPERECQPATAAAAHTMHWTQFQHGRRKVDSILCVQGLLTNRRYYYSSSTSSQY